MIWDTLAVLLVLISLPGTIELAFLTVSAWLPAANPVIAARRSIFKLAIIVPAHDEGEPITPCIASLHACDKPACELALVVVADNCSDDTAEVASRLGARVLVRNDPEKRGKGYALNFAFQRLLQEEFDAFIIIDADSWVAPNLLKAFVARFESGAEALQCVYRAPDRAASTKTRLAGIIWFAFNVVRPRARHFRGLSVGILGNGFGLSRQSLLAVPYDVGSITEDLEYFLRLLAAGIRVEFLADTTVWSELPGSEAAAESQRARWEGGRMRAIREWTPTLLRRLARGQTNALEPLLELWLFPLSYHAMLLAPLLLIPVNCGRVYGAFGLALLAAHAVTAVRLGWQWKDVLVLFRIPFYLTWKLAMLPRIVANAGKRASWVRTDRIGA